MDRTEAYRLLALSREAEWAFPTSYGESNLTAPGAEWVQRLLFEREAFAEAVRWLVVNGDGVAAAEIAANAWRLWLLAGDRDGGRAFLQPVVDDHDTRPTPWRAEALYGAGLIAIKQGSREESLARNEEALAVADEVGDPAGRTFGLLGLSRIAVADGDAERGRHLASSALDAARELPPRMRQALPHMLAQATRLGGDLDRAAELFAESLALNRSIGDQGMVPVELHNLGHVESRRGNAAAAEALFAEAEGLSRPDDPYDAAMTGLNRAFVAFARGDAGEADRLLAGVRSSLDDAGIELAQDDAAELDWLASRISEARAG